MVDGFDIYYSRNALAVIIDNVTDHESRKLKQYWLTISATAAKPLNNCTLGDEASTRRDVYPLIAINTVYGI